MRATLALLAGGLAGCSNLAIVLPRAELGEPPVPAPEEAAPARTHLADSLTTFRLENGLEVALLEDRTRPRVALDLWFRFAVREPGTEPGCAGAGLLAELARPRGSDDPLEELWERGVVVQAGATSERVKLLATGPAETLAPLLAELARRLGALRSAPDPAARAFVDERLGPASATLVLAGDLEPARARRWVEAGFGALAGGDQGAVSAPAPSKPAHSRARSSPESRPSAELTLSWATPAELGEGAAELELLATILGEGPAARLERRLVLETSLARAIEVGLEPGARASVFRITAYCRDEDPAEARTAILAVLTELAEHGPSAAEFARARARAEARFRVRMQSLLARAEAVQTYLQAFGDARGFERDLARWKQASAESVRAAARRLLDTPCDDFRPGSVTSTP